VIRIRKLPPTEMPWFPRRWVASREPDDDGIADHQTLNRFKELY
jgi:hypothetical protein